MDSQKIVLASILLLAFSLLTPILLASHLDNNAEVISSTKVSLKFEEWKVKFSKKYSSNVEIFRFFIFVENYQEILRHN